MSARAPSTTSPSVAPDDPAARTLIRIGEAALRTGVSERTLRYYEEIGLLCPAAHSPGGTRRYGEEELARVLRIRELQELMGLNLEEIRNVLGSEDRLLALRAAWRRNPDDEERRRILEAGLAEREALHARVSRQLERIAGFLAELEANMQRNRELLVELDRPGPPGP
ncbi:MAG TPA: MerR family transcriptional regulator [Acidimicrobiales bacterium]|nr:MerR family transcriptional regulator [Acidimicrobiales bacterium]